MFPLVEEPDFVLSLGTGEPGPHNYDMSADSHHNNQKFGMLPRMRDLMLEKTRDKTLRRAYKSTKLAFKFLHRIHRLSTEFDGTEPRLDEAKRIPELKLKVQEDPSLTRDIDIVVQCMVASLFYFELDSLPEKREGKYSGTGYILCSIRRNDPAFQVLLHKLLSNSAEFLLDSNPIPGSLQDTSYFDKNGNFRKRIEFHTPGKFTISLKQGSWNPCDISASPFSVNNLVRAQGLDAFFGRSDHGKRKRADEAGPARKRRRI